MNHLIIDGYNVIHAIPTLQKTLLHDLNVARELLIHSTAQLTHKRKFRATVVFDGIEPTEHNKHTVHAPIHVIFSSPVSADTRIKQLIKNSKQRTSLVIISSDREIISFATAYSCQTHTAKHFANLLAEEDDTVTEKSDISLTPHQIKEWLKIFGEK
ncbi:MAG: NYN domain-containing protein [Bacteriovoracaceae bacterium]|nr:NYN domain-containing protein [Bacteroidota bacterium]